MGKTFPAPTTAPAHQPFDINLEQAVLGSLLVDNRLIDEAAAEIGGNHFYDPLHARIFDAVVYLATEGTVSPVFLHSALKADPGLIEVGGIAYLAGLAAAAPALPNIRDYCLVLRDLAARRALISIAQSITEDAHLPPLETSATAIAARAGDALLEVGSATTKVRLSPFQVAQGVVDRLAKAAAGAPIPIIKTGWDKLDEEMGGLRGSDLTIILGKSGMGKSALMGSLALNTALAGVPTIFFSLEMTEEQLVERMVCDLDFYEGAGIPLWYSRVRNGNLWAGEFDRFMLGSRRLDGLPLEIIDDDGLTIQQISARARAFKAKHKGKIGLVLIDYLQIVEPTDARDNRERQVNQIARGAKSLAKRLDWPVVAGAQMNEDDTTKGGDIRRPQPKDARESKGILHEADVMLAPYRPAYLVELKKPLDIPPGAPDWIKWQADLKSVRDRFELLTLKNRHGRKVDFELWCEMGASAIRNQKPHRRMTAAEQAQLELLEGLV